MEWLKQASLRKSLFVIIIIFGVTGAGIVYLTLFILNNMVPYCCICRTPFSSLRWILPVVASVSMPILAVTTFYRLKLESPLSQLEAGTKRVMESDLDFSITTESEDELGKLCQSFEFMRIELLKNNLEMQQKMEERKRLNAAFAHDLRNPVTVLNGSAKVLQAKLDKGDLTSQSVEENISLISQYTKRIENYIQAMTSVQKLEEIALVEKNICWLSLVKELESSLSILAQESKKAIRFTKSEDYMKLFVDQHVIHNVAENLVSNALRFSKSEITVQLILEGEEVVLKVSDDGPGFSKALLEKGVVPFMRDTNPTLGPHFGMGLYISHLLCKKHGGQLTLANHDNGGEVTATFKYREV